MKRLRKHDNRGFTLVELVVVTAILAIVGGAVAGFLAISTRSYKSVSNEVDLQTEAQVAMNQFQTLLMNAEAGVNFSEKTIEIYNTQSRYVITWDEDAQRLYYKEEARKKDEGSGAYTTEFQATEGAGSLFAEYVDDFSASVNTVEKTIVVNISLHFTKGERSYQASEDISLRNTVPVNKDVSTIYDGAQDNAASTTYDEIKVSLGNMSFPQEPTEAYSVSLSGADVTIPLSVTIIGTGFPSQEYTCTFVDSEGTKMQKTPSGSSAAVGSIVISGKETASTLTLLVASKIDPTVRCTIAINITNTETTTGNGLYLSGETTVNRGGQVTIYAKDSQESDAKEYSANEVTWSVSEEYRNIGVEINAGVLTVPNNLDYNTAYTITVTATLNKTNESKTFEVQVPKVSVGFSTEVNGYYQGWYELSIAYKKLGESALVYYQVTGVENGKISFQWSNSVGTDLTGEFSKTVSILGDNTITFTKTDGTFSGRSYNSIFKYMIGTPSVEGQVISSCRININNTPTNNVDIGGNGYNLNYYIPIEETDGRVKLEDTDYWYQVTYVTIYDPWSPYSYYKLTLYDSSGQEIYYRAWSTTSNWERL
jgi:prepilin-type N-terminal cleavage/methylation domain-containing protein